MKTLLLTFKRLKQDIFSPVMLYEFVFALGVGPSITEDTYVERHTMWVQIEVASFVLNVIYISKVITVQNS